MKVSNPFSHLSPSMDKGRNAFDRSFRSTYHYSAGQLIPVFAQPCIAGSHVEINRRIFQRTADVNTAAFSLMDTHIDFFAVPLRLLYSRWEEFKTNMNDVTSSALVLGTGDENPNLNPPAYVPCFNLNKTAIQAALFDTGLTDGAGFSFTSGALRLLDMLGYGNFYTRTDFLDQNFLVNTLRLQAYQKIYFDHYRNTNYEENNPFCYNVDKFMTSADPTTGLQTSVVVPDFFLRNICTLRYVNYRKDLFKSVYPSLNYSANLGVSSSWRVPSDVQYRYGSSNAYLANNQNQVLLTSPLADTTTVFNINQIRAGFALDKLLRAAAYAPKHIRDQYQAQFGVSIPDNHTESVRIGSFHNSLPIGEVTSTADTETANGGLRLGTIGGKGVGSDDFGDTIKYTCPCDCIIMGVQYTLPRTMYDSTRCDVWNAHQVRNDFFSRAFENLGLRPVYKYQLGKQVASITDGSPKLNLYQSNILGYSEPYMEYKTGIDTNHGLFGYVGDGAPSEGSTLRSFVNHSNYTELFALNNDYFGGNGVSAEFFKVKPSDLNSIFVAQYDGTYNTDQFFGHTDFMFKCVADMSVHGQPSL